MNDVCEDGKMPSDREKFMILLIVGPSIIKMALRKEGRN